MAKYDEWQTEDKLLLIEDWARLGLTDEQIAENMGISRSTLNEWKKRFSAISDTLKKGKEVVDIQVENALLKRALGYEYIEITEERSIPSLQDQRHGGKTSFTEKEWQFALMYFGYQCCYCGKKLGAKATKDHVLPLAKGGEFCKENVLPCCQSCNSSKKDKDMLSWFEKQPFFETYKVRKIGDYFSLIGSMERLDRGEDKELTVTKRVIKHVAPDTTAQIFWLKNRRPEQWRDKQKEDTSGLPDLLVDEP